MSYLNKRKNAILIAFSGIFQSLKKETHLKLHFITAALVIGLGFWFNVSKTNWIIILLCITLVICLEMFNSALEKLCDIIMPEQNPKIKYIKDVAAGAVLVACIFAVIAGLMVFIPYLNR